MGLTVWRSDAPALGAHLVVHTSPECWYITRMPHPPTMVEIPLADVVYPELCRGCWPQAPRTRKVVHQLCLACRQTHPRPCAHNGAVLAHVPIRDPKRPHVAQRWVWPENAHHFTLATPIH
jgi:hypothetical protein